MEQRMEPRIEERGIDELRTRVIPVSPAERERGSGAQVGSGDGVPVSFIHTAQHIVPVHYPAPYNYNIQHTAHSENNSLLVNS